LNIQVSDESTEGRTYERVSLKTVMQYKFSSIVMHNKASFIEVGFEILTVVAMKIYDF
jgi:hypothetical protein